MPSETVKRCMWTQEASEELVGWERDVSDPFGLKMERLTLYALPEKKERVEAFINAYNARVRYASYFLAAWFLVENIIFIGLFAGLVPNQGGLDVFGSLIALLGLVYGFLPYLMIDLYTAYSIPKAVLMVRLAATVLVFGGLALVFFV